MIFGQEFMVQEEKSKDNWQTVGTIKGNLEPFSGELAVKNYGYEEKTTHRLFTKGTIKSRQRVVDKEGVAYLVKYVAPFKLHKEVLLEYEEDHITSPRQYWQSLKAVRSYN